MKSFWKELKKPFLALAPMDDVTDTVFRQIIKECYPPDVFFTEFTSTDALVSSGKNDSLKRLRFTKIEHPIVAQIWGNNPQNYLKSAKMIAEMGFDGIDINMGCPDRKIVKRGSCSGLIKNPTLACELIAAAKEGAPDLPVSVKTRLGYSKVDKKWIATLLKTNLAALTVHGRTVAEMSKVPAHWQEIAKIVKMRDKINKETLIIGNGDVKSYQEAKNRAEKHRVDGVMIGRGIFLNPYVFSPANKEITIEQRIKLLIKHIKLFQATWRGSKNFDILRKFFKTYINNFPEASKIRNELMLLKEKELADYVDKLAKSTALSLKKKC